MKKRLLKSGLTLLGGQAADQIAAFARNLILARVLTKADFGLAATFSMVAIFLETLSNFAADKVVVQAKDGQKEEFQATAQLLRVLRGLFAGTILFFLAGPLARQFNVPEATWAFRCLALLPIMAGLFHLDIERLQRDMKFGIFSWVYGGSNVITALMAYPFAHWFPDWRAMLFLLLLREFLLSLGTHILAERPYRFHWDGKVAKQIYRFGTPLVLNSLLMALFLQGDRFLIGSAEKNFPQSGLSLQDLGVYFATLSLIMAPGRIFASLASTFILPLLSQAQDEEGKFRYRYHLCILPPALLGAIVAFGFGAVGKDLIGLVYGEKYAAGGLYAGWLALAMAVRILRVVPTVAVMAKAHTSDLVRGNLIRVLALPAAAVALFFGYGLHSIILFAILGELGAFSFLVSRLSHYSGIRWKEQLLPLGLISMGALAGFLARAFLHYGSLVNIGLACLLGFCLLGFSYISLADLRKAVGFFLPNKLGPKEAQP
ncbi:MAG TPA: hypothetical protein ENK02_03365 [Planctomycetes bacterium]|nr:hypothetical protein [Planctomycetota bacterium]